MRALVLAAVALLAWGAAAVVVDSRPPCEASNAEEAAAHLRTDGCAQLVVASAYFDDKALSDLATAISESAELVSLTIGASQLGDAALGVLAEALGNRETPLRRLSLPHNSIHGAGVVRLLSQMSKPGLSLLQELDLSFNNIGDEVAAAIADILAVSNLRVLNLEHNPIGNEGGVTIANNLVGSKLRSLVLNGNKFGDPVIEALKSALLTKKTMLEELELMDVDITANGGTHLRELQQHAQARDIKLLRWKFNHVMPEGRTRRRIAAEEWTEEHVAKWLAAVNPAFKQYSVAFRNHAINGRVLLTLAEEDLEELVPNKLHRRRIATEIKALADVMEVRDEL